MRVLRDCGVPPAVGAVSRITNRVFARARVTWPVATAGPARLQSGAAARRVLRCGPRARGARGGRVGRARGHPWRPNGGHGVARGARACEQDGCGRTRCRDGVRIVVVAVAGVSCGCVCCGGRTCDHRVVRVIVRGCGYRVVLVWLPVVAMVVIAFIVVGVVVPAGVVVWWQLRCWALLDV